MTNEENATTTGSSTELVRSIDWKQGLIIAMGIPILIVPSLCDLSVTLWGMSIILWICSVLSGFLLNIPLGELCATFGVAGIGGSIQYVFRDDERYEGRRLNIGRMIGSYGAWAYFSTWVPVIPIFTLMTGDYLFGYFDVFSDLNGTYKMLFYLLIGALIYGFIIISGRKGLEGGAKVQLLLAIITIIPILIIVIVPLFTGDFHLETITNEITPTGWRWNGDTLLLLFGCFSVAQWSAVGWESAATYGAEYKNPGRDVPKALISCGLLCLFMYFVISFCMYGTLGIDGILNAPVGGAATLIPVARSDFGEIGGAIAVILLIAGMVMIIQTAFLGAARTIQIMAKEGNFPMIFAKTNSYGVPMNAMYFEMLIGFLLIICGVSASEILAVSALAFNMGFGFCMWAFIKARKDPRFKDVERTYKAPKIAYYGAWLMMIMEFFVMSPGLLYYVYVNMGILYVLLGICVNLLYLPCWMVLQWWNTQSHPDMVPAIRFDKEENPTPKAIGVFVIFGAVVAFMTGIGAWDHVAGIAYNAFDMMNLSTGDFQQYVPVMIFAIGLVIAVIQSVNFFLKKSSGAIALLCVILSVIGMVMLMMFSTWDYMDELVGCFYISLGGLLLSFVLSTCQLIGTISKSKNILNRTYA